MDVPGAHHRLTAEAVPEVFRPGSAGGQLSAPLVVAIDYRIARRRTAGAGEQQLLGRKVIVHRGVEVQMVLREVGEDGSVKLQAVDATQREGVR